MAKIEQSINSVKVTMRFEGMELPDYCIDLGRKILEGKITGDDARNILKQKYKIKSN